MNRVQPCRLLALKCRHDMDLILKKVDSDEYLYEYQRDLLQFRLKLSLKAPSTWTTYMDQWPKPRLLIHHRPAKVPEDVSTLSVDVIEEFNDCDHVLFNMVQELKSISPYGLILEMKKQQMLTLRKILNLLIIFRTRTNS